MPPLLPLLNRYNVKFWELVGALEIYGLRVRCFIADGASTNRRSNQLHSSAHPDDHITHRAVNLYNPDRDIYFVSDVPHLFKTTRNNYQNSGRNKATYIHTIRMKKNLNKIEHAMKEVNKNK